MPSTELNEVGMERSESEWDRETAGPTQAKYLTNFEMLMMICTHTHILYFIAVL